MTIGARMRSMSRVLLRMIPSPIEIGSLMRLTMKKNHAVVPRKVETVKREARKYIEVTGPPAFAAIVVNPARVP